MEPLPTSNQVLCEFGAVIAWERQRGCPEIVRTHALRLANWSPRSKAERHVAQLTDGPV